MSLLLFRTDANYLKVFDQGSVNFSSSATQTVTHDLGYVPFVKFYLKDTDGLIKSPNSYLNNSILDYVIVDSSNVEFNTTSTGDVTVYYKIYYDRAV